MKKVIFIMVAMFLLLGVAETTVVNAQVLSRKEIKKRKKEQMSKVKGKAIKKARKAAAAYEKEDGWQVNVGGLPIEKMLESSWMKQYEMRVDEDMNETNAYVWATGNGVARTKSAATMQAMEFAKVELAGKVQSSVAALTTSNIANAQLDNVSAETEMSIVQSAKTMTSAKLNNLKSVVNIFRTKIPRKGLKKMANKTQLQKGMVEVQVMMFYDLNQVNLQVRDAIKQELKDDLKDNEAELKKLMDL